MTTNDKPDDAWKALAPTFSNVNSVWASPFVVRVNFGEGFGDGGKNWRTAVVMHPNDAEVLANLILATLANIKKQLAEATKN